MTRAAASMLLPCYVPRGDSPQEEEEEGAGSDEAFAHAIDVALTSARCSLAEVFRTINSMIIIDTTLLMQTVAREFRPTCTLFGPRLPGRNLVLWTDLYTLGCTRIDKIEIGLS